MSDFSIEIQAVNNEKPAWKSLLAIYKNDDPVVYCPIRGNRELAPQRCVEFQKTFNCGIDCSQADLAKELSFALKSMLKADGMFRERERKYTCIMCGVNQLSRQNCRCKPCTRKLENEQRREKRKLSRIYSCVECGAENSCKNPDSYCRICKIRQYSFNKLKGRMP